MPLIKTTLAATIDADKKLELARKLSKTTADIIGKPERYVASLVEDGAVMTFDGNEAKAAFVEVKSIGGLDGSVNQELSSSVADILQEGAGIIPESVYINFTDVPASHWGWNKSTFG